MRLRVHHRTEYSYSQPVRESANELRLYPPNTRWQACEASYIGVLPATRLQHYDDLHLNRVHRFEVLRPHDRLVIDSRATVLTRGKVDFENLPYGSLHRDLAACRQREECHPFLQDSTFVTRSPEAWRQALDVQDGSEDVFQTSYAIMDHIFRDYRYVSGATDVSTHAGEVMERREGVCQDFAHVMVAMCRAIGIPARYVSGYFFDATHDNSLRGAQASHAWAEVYLDRFGWIGMDPTNNKVIDETYIVLATGRDYRDVAPVAGTFFGGGESRMSVDVTVTRLPGDR